MRSWLTISVVPWVVWGFFKLITPFIDPLTREKLKFNEDIRQYVPPEQLWKEFGGDVDFEYDHAAYWPALLKACEEKRAERKARWEKAGKQYGESETYLKGGDVENDVQLTAAVEEPSKAEETMPIQPAEKEPSEVIAPIQTHGTEANGNTDIVAVVPSTELTTDGDRA